MLVLGILEQGCADTYAKTAEVELFSEQSFESISKANRKAYNTTRYWIDKIFLALKGTQDGIMLSGKVYLDETYLKVIKRDVERRADGKEYRGISRNQICISHRRKQSTMDSRII